MQWKRTSVRCEVSWCRALSDVFPFDGGLFSKRSLPVCKRVTKWGFRGVRVGEATNPGPKKGFLKGVPLSRKRQQRTMLDSDAPL